MSLLTIKKIPRFRGYFFFGNLKPALRYCDVHKTEGGSVLSEDLTKPKRRIMNWGLAVSLFFMAGLYSCDRPETNMSAGVSDNSGSGQRAGPDVSRRSGPTVPKRSMNYIPIRVYLWESNSITVKTPDVSSVVSVRDSESNQENLSLSAGSYYHLYRNSDIWNLEDKYGSNILPEDLKNANILEFQSRDSNPISVGIKRVKPYLGIIQCQGGSASDGFAVVNVLDIEDYLAGVVPAEMPAYWHKAALRAQAIAARTYALYQMHCGNQNHTGWDIGSGQASQVYNGLLGQSRRTNEAVHETQGLVLTFGEPGEEKIFPTFYSSVCGGHTQDAAPVFGLAIASLNGHECYFCQGVAPAEKYRWPEVAIDKDKVNDLLLKRYPALRRLDRIVDIKILEKSEYGRNVRVELIGSNGKTSRIRGEDLRLSLTSKETPILSSWFRLVDDGDRWRFTDGQGWGHGVGMCQCGCQQMAMLGRNCVEILQFYYPDAVLLRAY
ncbi:MAG: SpoIID/LytB domain-containing protein [Sedimentisphaerales bacterium]|nr:SpoIID/LytB domain-containing protein [Sedimentisphaerales bacterium]